MKKYIKCFLAVLPAVVVIYVAINAAVIWNYGKMDLKCPSDTVIVLGAGTDSGEVSSVFRERINHGIWLYQNGYAEKIIFTGGYGEGNEQSDAYTAKQYAKSRGIGEEDILIEEKSTITQENLKYAKQIMDRENINTAIIVSDPLHMKRAMVMAEDYGIEAYSSPTPTTRYTSMKTKLPFLGRELFFYLGYKIYRLL